MLKRLKEGVMLEDGEAKFDQIHFSGGEGANTWYHVVLHEGKNKEVRRLWESQGVTVSRLTRVRYGDLTLPSYLKFGRWQDVEGDDLKGLLKKVGF
jgi:23S rRNA pseudouridine2605 synthase